MTEIKGDYYPRMNALLQEDEISKLQVQVNLLLTENAALKEKIAQYKKSVTEPVENILSRATDATKLVEPLASCISWYIDENGGINIIYQIDPISEEERLAVIAHVLANDVIYLLHHVDILKAQLAQYEEGRPMSEAPRDGTSILLRHVDGYYVPATRESDHELWCSYDGYYGDDEFECWFPLPGGAK
jgi:hypothetical protein